MSLRVGYVNVQGLSARAWSAVCSLLDTSLDFLFLAETWYVDHQLYLPDRRLIASTTKPREHRSGRPSGGIYLLGTAEARGRVKDYVVLSERAITFAVGRRRVSGIYFLPSISTDDIS